jgi:hypothetical protein
MPSDRQQLNVRLDPAASELWGDLVPRVKAALRLDLSQAQIVALALQALAEKYPAAEPSDAGAAASRTGPAATRKRRGRAG